MASYAGVVMMSIPDELARATIGRTFNQYAEGARAPLLRARLAAYLESRAEAPVLLVGEAPGYAAPASRASRSRPSAS